MSMLVSGGLSIAGGIYGAISSGKRAREAAEAAEAQRRELARLEASRQDIINPYASTKNLSNLATDLSGMMTNPYASLGVATNAAKMQIEQSDLALAQTLDTLRATGASAGGATALAQAALRSKQEVAADIEKQETTNEQLRAGGEQKINEAKIAEQRRLQTINLSEGQRVQQADAAGKSFEFNAKEQRQTAQINRVAGLADRYAAQEAQAQADQTGAITGTLSSLANIYSGFKSGQG